MSKIMKQFAVISESDKHICKKKEYKLFNKKLEKKKKLQKKQNYKMACYCFKLHKSNVNYAN